MQRLRQTVELPDKPVEHLRRVQETEADAQQRLGTDDPLRIDWLRLLLADKLPQ